MNPACRDCAHWKAHQSGRQGDCLKDSFTSSSYRHVGSLGTASIYEATKADYWCTLFEARLPATEGATP